MKRSRFSEEQIIGILNEHQAGLTVAELCRKHGISDATFYTWGKKYGGMEISDAKRLKGLEDENRKLKNCLPSRCWTMRRSKRCLEKTSDARLEEKGRGLGYKKEGLLASPCLFAGREFCDRPDRHPYELFLQLEEIEHHTTKVRRPH